MLAHLPPLLRGVITATLLGLNTLVAFTTMIPPALVKLLVPATGVRNACTRMLNAIANRWVANNNAWIHAVNRSRWDVQGVAGLHRRGWYLVSSNHQSWVDILVLQQRAAWPRAHAEVLPQGRVDRVPVIGLAWWALDFPFMKRGRGHGARSSDPRPRARPARNSSAFPLR